MLLEAIRMGHTIEKEISPGCERSVRRRLQGRGKRVALKPEERQYPPRHGHGELGEPGSVGEGPGRVLVEGHKEILGRLLLSVAEPVLTGPAQERHLEAVLLPAIGARPEP